MCRPIPLGVFLEETHRTCVNFHGSLSKTNLPRVFCVSRCFLKKPHQPVGPPGPIKIHQNMRRPNCYFAKTNAGISWPDAIAGVYSNVSFLGRYFLGSKNRSSESRNNRKLRSFTFFFFWGGGGGWVIRPLEITRLSYKPLEITLFLQLL